MFLLKIKINFPSRLHCCLIQWNRLKLNPCRAFFKLCNIINRASLLLSCSICCSTWGSSVGGLVLLYGTTVKPGIKVSLIFKPLMLIKFNWKLSRDKKQHIERRRIKQGKNYLFGWNNFKEIRNYSLVFLIYIA